MSTGSLTIRRPCVIIFTSRHLTGPLWFGIMFLVASEVIGLEVLRTEYENNKGTHALLEVKQPALEQNISLSEPTMAKQGCLMAENYFW